MIGTLQRIIGGLKTSGSGFKGVARRYDGVLNDGGTMGAQRLPAAVAEKAMAGLGTLPHASRQDRTVAARDTGADRPLALIRKPHGSCDLARSGASWLGGLPRLGDVPWPRARDGQPLHHLAQIDLATLPAAGSPTAMPDQGSLVFFGLIGVAVSEACVIYIPAGQTVDTPPPKDLTPVYDGGDWTYYFQGVAPDDAPHVFRRWPVSFLPLPTPADPADPVEMQDFMQARFGESAAALSTRRMAQDFPEFHQTWVYDTLIRFAGSLAVAQSRYPTILQEAKTRVAALAQQLNAHLNAATSDSARIQTTETHLQAARKALLILETEHAEFDGFANEVRAWAEDKYPWAHMPKDDIALLVEAFEVVHAGGQTPDSGPLQAFYPQLHTGYQTIANIREATYRAMTTDPAGFVLMPKALQEEVNARNMTAYAGESWHQMFGPGADIQGAAPENRPDILLMQLCSDPMMDWMWGDFGAIQFWITPAELAARRFDKVRFTVEGN